MNDLKERVWKANIDLVKHHLVALTFGNVSGFDPASGLVVIKPSGVSYGETRPQDMVVVNLEGRRVEGDLQPSSDTPTHLAVYRAFQDIAGVAHSHSLYATMFAQAGRSIPCMGTTHADHFKGEVPVTRWISEEETDEDYEGNTGRVIVERFTHINPLEVPAVLVAGHGPFVWGSSPEEAVINSVALETVAQLAWGTLGLNPEVSPLPEYLLYKHFQRKHGPQAYYGQKTKGEEQ
jgi:L-ribulose-5-phosphate 4-epimerase